MQGIKRRIIYLSSYEVFGLLISSSVIATLSNSQLSHTAPLAIAITTVAVTWNLFYNLLFESWEKRQVLRKRTVKRRIFHAIGFQLTLIVFLIPLIAWWMNISLIDAFLLDVSLVFIIPLYSFVFIWIFDKLFGEPLSAMP